MSKTKEVASVWNGLGTVIMKLMNNDSAIDQNAVIKGFKPKEEAKPIAESKPATETKTEPTVVNPEAVKPDTPVQETVKTPEQP
jgi:hypothetical protein